LITNSRFDSQLQVGGLGMAKYIDSNESRRLSRLKTIKSSLSSKTSHSGWQKQQIEKRRKEQLRQRKLAKKKPIGQGIQVDTSVSKSDAVSKCGLKLKVTTENTGKVDNISKQKTQIKPKALVEPPSQKQGTNKPVSFPLNRRRYAPKKKKQESNNVESAKLPLLKDKVSNIGKKPNKQQPTKQPTKQLATVSHNSIKSNKPSNSQKLYGPSQRRVAEDKENSDNSLSKKETHPKKSQQVIAPKKSVTTSPKKEYFMDIHSLRREHADALKMLEELDKKEGQQRRSLESADNPSSADDDNNYVPLGIRRNQNSERDSYGSINNTLDDEFVKDCSSRSTSFDDVAPATVTDSFLNMTHLSISLRDDFDTEGIDKSERSQSLTPNRNRSFASSFASDEKNSDFFGDADVDS